MARFKPIRDYKRSRQGLNATKSALAKLRKAGLIGRGEYRGKPGGSAYKVIRKYRDVIEGRAVSVKPKTKLIPKELRKELRQRHGRLIVPKPSGTISTQIVRAKGGIQITRTRKTPRGKVREIVIATPKYTISNLPKEKVYRVSSLNPRAEWWSRHFATEESLNNFLGYYDNRDNWADISIVDLPEAYA